MKPLLLSIALMALVGCKAKEPRFDAMDYNAYPSSTLENDTLTATQKTGDSLIYRMYMAIDSSNKVSQNSKYWQSVIIQGDTFDILVPNRKWKVETKGGTMSIYKWEKRKIGTIPIHSDTSSYYPTGLGYKKMEWPTPLFHDTALICEPNASPDFLIKWHMDRVLYWMKVKQGKTEKPLEWPYKYDTIWHIKPEPVKKWEERKD